MINEAANAKIPHKYIMIDKLIIIIGVLFLSLGLREEYIDSKHFRKFTCYIKTKYVNLKKKFK